MVNTEDKELLLNDLCTRLRYGVKGKVYAEVSDGEYDMEGEMIFYDEPFDVILDGINVSTEEIHVVAIGNEDTVDFIEIQQTDGAPYTIDDFKPYLRPMSSMTDEEFQEIHNICPHSTFNKTNCSGWIIGMDGSEYGRISRIDEISKLIDCLNKKGFDYRDLIPKGLALEAPEGMY